MAMPPAPSSIDNYIATAPDWQQEIMHSLRSWLHQAAPDIKEDIKWGAPYFLVNNQGIAWMFAVKGWVHFGFRQGALLPQDHQLFVPTDNKAQRAIHFGQDQDMHQTQVRQLLAEAVAIARSGKKVDLKPTKTGSKVFVLPQYYQQFLQQHDALNEYKKRPYYQQKGWIQWIEQAKQQQTKDRRCQSMLSELRNGTYMPAKG